MDTDFYPVGAVIAYGSELEVDDNWLLCDGREVNCGDFPELFSAIEYIYGGNKTNQKFNIPDYRGRFLRGATHESLVDPDSSSRTPMPNGIIDDMTGPGSIQEYATKRPSINFTAAFPHLPTATKDSHGETATNNIGVSGSGEKIDTCTSGGDKETRPKNIYVNYYIKSRG